MSISLIAGVIILLVICSLIVSSISYSRQKAIAQRRKEIARYKQTIEELSEYRNFLLKVDPDYDILTLLQKQLLHAVEQILDRVPDDQQMQRRTDVENALLQQIMQQQRNKPLAQVMESDEELSQAKKNLSSIAKHLDLSRNSGTLSPASHQNFTVHIKNIGLLIDVESHQHQAQLFAEQGDVVLYLTHLKQARDALRKAPIESEEKNHRIRQLTEVLNETKRTNKITPLPPRDSADSEDSTESESSIEDPS